MNVNLDDLVRRATDKELNIMRAMASKHLNWRKQHREEMAKAKKEGKCKCGALLSPANRLLDRGYVYGVECERCR
jgi:hypothetical protein